MTDRSDVKRAAGRVIAAAWQRTVLARRPRLQITRTVGELQLQYAPTFSEDLVAHSRDQLGLEYIRLTTTIRVGLISAASHCIEWTRRHA